MVSRATVTRAVRPAAETRSGGAVTAVADTRSGLVVGRTVAAYAGRRRGECRGEVARCRRAALRPWSDRIGIVGSSVLAFRPVGVRRGWGGLGGVGDDLVLAGAIDLDHLGRRF